MNLDITLSINKREEAQHNTFIMVWDPTTSHYTMEELDSDMQMWAKGCWPENFTWDIDEWHRAHKGDRFFMVRRCEHNGGIFAAGRFTSEPFVGDNGDKHYVGMEFEAIIHPERAEIIATEEVERELTDTDWRKITSGHMLNKEDAVRMELMWRDYVGRNKALYLPRAVKNEYYDMRSDIDKAIALASRAHAADYDLDGNPTILHPLAVGMMGRNDAERIVGFLHDVVEDTRYDFSDLEEEGFSEEVIATLRLLTHDKHTPYMEYVERICTSGNMTAIHVKMNDLRHNLARGREGGHMRCVEKHTVALAFIEAYLAEHPTISHA